MTFYQKLKKLQDIMGEFPWEKDGINRFQSYKYITEKQYKQNFKKALKQVGLLWKVEQQEYQYIPDVSDKMHMVICKFKGMLIDPETAVVKNTSSLVQERITEIKLFTSCHMRT